METFYSKIFFDILRLIQGKQFKRGIVLCKFLIDKGFRTAELIVVMSYAFKMIEGPKKALEVLEQLIDAQKFEKEETLQTLLKSPLIALAKTQYEIANKNLKQALCQISQFELSNNPNQLTVTTNLSNILQSLKANYTSIFQAKQSKNSQENETTQEGKQNNLTKYIAQSFRKQINQVSEYYLHMKNIEQEKKQADPSQKAIRYGQFYLQYDEIKQRILTILSDEIRIESQSIFNVRTAKKQKLLKKQNTKQIFFKDVKASWSLENNNKLNKLLNSSQSKNIQEEKLKQDPKPQNKIEELQTLLLQVNRFINFFKNRLKSYGASRIREVDIIKN